LMALHDKAMALNSGGSDVADRPRLRCEILNQYLEQKNSFVSLRPGACHDLELLLLEWIKEAIQSWNNSSEKSSSEVSLLLSMQTAVKQMTVPEASDVDHKMQDTVLSANEHSKVMALQQVVMGKFETIEEMTQLTKALAAAKTYKKDAELLGHLGDVRTLIHRFGSQHISTLMTDKPETLTIAYIEQILCALNAILDEKDALPVASKEAVVEANVTFVKVFRAIASFCEAKLKLENILSSEAGGGDEFDPAAIAFRIGETGNNRVAFWRRQGRCLPLCGRIVGQARRKGMNCSNIFAVSSKIPSCL
jgi:hypothetical protein